MPDTQIAGTAIACGATPPTGNGKHSADRTTKVVRQIHGAQLCRREPSSSIVNPRRGLQRTRDSPAF
jgi:hypothetical protein